MATIKKGTYRFNDVLTAPSGGIEQMANYTVNVHYAGNTMSIDCDGMAVGDVTIGQTSYWALCYHSPSLEQLFYEGWVEVYGFENVAWEVDWYGEGIKTITITEDTEVSTEFYDWFINNSKPLKLIKAGTYRFNEELTNQTSFSQKFEFSFEFAESEEVFKCSEIIITADLAVVIYMVVEESVPSGLPLPIAFPAYSIIDGVGKWNSASEGCRTITVTTDQWVSVDFYDWFDANAYRLMIKAGTYRWNEILTLPTTANHSFRVPLDFSVTFNVNPDEVAYFNSILEAEGLAKLTHDAYIFTLEFNEIYYTHGLQQPEDYFEYLSVGYEQTSISVYPEDAYALSLADYYLSPNEVYHWSSNSTEPLYWGGDPWAQTITIPHDVIFTDTDGIEFATWFTTNAVEQKKISGKWKFKDVLQNIEMDINVNFTANAIFEVTEDMVEETEVPAGTYTCTFECYRMHYDNYGSKQEGTPNENSLMRWYYNRVLLNGEEYEPPDAAHRDFSPYDYVPPEAEYWKEGYGESIKTVDFGTEPQYVSEEFYSWLTANASEIPPSATVTYNGKTVASLYDGQTATLQCKSDNIKMLSDVVVTACNLEVNIIYNDSIIASLTGVQTATLLCKGDNVKMLSDVIIKVGTKLPNLVGISIRTLPKTQYKVNELLNVDGGYLTLNYDDGSTGYIALHRDWIVKSGENGFTTAEVGTYTAKVIYNDYVTYYTYTVTEAEETLAAGLYDADDNLVASWDTLVNTYGMDCEKDYDYPSYETDITSPHYILTNNDELANGTKLIIGNNVTSIGNRAFYNCTSLSSVVIGNSVTSISNYAFYGCTSLKDVYYAGSEADWAKITIGPDNDGLTNATVHYNYTG